MMYLGESFSIFCHCFFTILLFFPFFKTLYIALSWGVCTKMCSRRDKQKFLKWNCRKNFARCLGGGRRRRTEKSFFFDGKVYFVFKVFLISMIYGFRAIKKRNGVSRCFLPLLVEVSVQYFDHIFSGQYYSTMISYSTPGSWSKLMATVFDSDTVHKFWVMGAKGLIYSNGYFFFVREFEEFLCAVGKSTPPFLELKKEGAESLTQK